MQIPEKLLDVNLFGQSQGTCGEFCLIAAKTIFTNESFFKNESPTQVVDGLIEDRQLARDYSKLVDVANVQLRMKAMICSLNNFSQFKGIGLIRLQWASYQHSTQVKGGREKNFFYDLEHFVLVIENGSDGVQFWEPSFGFNIDRNLGSSREWLGSGKPIWKKNAS